MASRSWVISTESVASKPELSSVMIRLMLLVNDVSLAADANDSWASTEEQKRVSRKSTARMYFIRVLLAHVHEGLKIVGEIQASPALRASVKVCDRRTQADFEELRKFLHSPERQIFERVRNKCAFHYDTALPDRFLHESARREPGKLWSCSLGHEPLDWRFELADAIMDRQMIRYGFDQPEEPGPERTASVERLGKRVDQIARMLTGFAGHYVRTHASRWR